MATCGGQMVTMQLQAQLQQAWCGSPGWAAARHTGSCQASGVGTRRGVQAPVAVRKGVVSMMSLVGAAAWWEACAAWPQGAAGCARGCHALHARERVPPYSLSGWRMHHSNGMHMAVSGMVQL